MVMFSKRFALDELRSLIRFWEKKWNLISSTEKRTKRIDVFTQKDVDNLHIIYPLKGKEDIN